MNEFRSFLRPNFLKFALLAILILISSSIVTGFEATSKVTWHASRGFPFPYMTIFDYVHGGRCQQNAICFAVNVRDFSVFCFLLDVILLYLVSCATAFAYEILKKRFSKGNFRP